MPDNIQRTKGRASAYKFDRGGTPAESGPFIGKIKNNVDPARMGRLQVYIEQFSGGDEDDDSLWRTVSYLPPFYGSTYVPAAVGDSGPGTFLTNQQSYGMWFTPPDLGVYVMCFFVEGDPNQGFYMGVVPDEAINHMVPAIGASRKYSLEPNQQALLGGARQLPVTEINVGSEAIALDPRFFDQEKPVHSVLAGIMFQQGLITDPIRGPITSNSQRESPSTVYGVSTPGRPIYQGGMTDLDIKRQLETEQLRPQDIAVIGRRGGHSIVMDDGDLEGQDDLIRIRTAKGHQITMSDNGDCFYITHANGQTWVELGKQGTVDVFSTNSVNIRTQGTINLHADRDINMYAGGTINIKSKVMKLQAEASLDLISEATLNVYSKDFIGVRSDGTLALKSVKNGGWDAGSVLRLKGGCVDINGGAAPPTVRSPRKLKDFKLADTTYTANRGWQSQAGELSTIVTRAPTHEPYAYHNQGTANLTSLGPPTEEELPVQSAEILTSIQDTQPIGVIDAANYATQPAASLAVGSIEPAAVTGLLAQAAQVSGQSAFDVTEAGIGKFATNAQQLEASGFLKPGTVQNFLSDPAQLQSVLQSPTVWTGREGVDSLAGFLGDSGLQDRVQQQIMITNLTGLQQAGVVTGQESPAELAPFVQAATKFGVSDTVAWVKGQATPEVASNIGGVARGAQYAVQFVQEKLPPSLGTGARIGGFVDTTNRGGLDQNVRQILGNPKIPVPDFGGGLYSGTTNQDLTYSGNDSTIWDRINTERLRRGLPGLAAIGSPRPV
jgi:hypothetical protein